MSVYYPPTSPSRAYYTASAPSHHSHRSTYYGDGYGDYGYGDYAAGGAYAGAGGAGAYPREYYRASSQLLCYLC